MRKRVMCAILACSMLTPVFMLTGCGSEKDGVKRLKLSINTNQSQVDMAEAMAEKIEELSDGKMVMVSLEATGRWQKQSSMEI